MSEKRQVLKAAGIVGVFTLISRLTGVIRDSVLAATFGAGRMQDVFLTAFELPNMVRRVMGEGALSAFIVPLIGERRERDGEAATWLFFNRVFNFMLLVSLILAIGGMFFAREMFLLFGGAGWYLHSALAGLGLDFVQPPAGGMSPEETGEWLALGTRMTRIMFPFLIGLTLAAIMMGACHSLRRFATASLGSVMLNLTMITTGGLALALRRDDLTTAHWLCWAVLAGAALRVALMVPTLVRGGWRWQPALALRDRELLKLMSMMGLAIVTMSISQVNIIVSNLFALYLGEGIKSALVFSQRLIQFPMALTATAVATAMLPQLTSFLLQGRRAELRDMMAYSKRLEMILINPAMIGLIVLGLPILQLIYEHMNFTAGDTRATYIALVFYAPGLLPLGWMRLLMPLAYARKDMITPLKAALAGMMFNVVANAFFALMTPMQQGGLALANTLALFVNYGVLAWCLRADLRSEPGEAPRIAETFWKSMLASAVSCGCGWGVYRGLTAWLGAPETTLAQAALLLPVIGGVAVLYFALARVLRVPDMEQATALLRRRLRRGKQEDFSHR